MPILKIVIPAIEPHRPIVVHLVASPSSSHSAVLGWTPLSCGSTRGFRTAPVSRQTQPNPVWYSPRPHSRPATPSDSVPSFSLFRQKSMKLEVNKRTKESVDSDTRTDLGWRRQAHAPLGCERIRTRGVSQRGPWRRSVKRTLC